MGQAMVVSTPYLKTKLPLFTIAGVAKVPVAPALPSCKVPPLNVVLPV
jgi:hypothetical protein